MASRLSETGTNDHPAETTVKVPSAFLPEILKPPPDSFLLKTTRSTFPELTTKENKCASHRHAISATPLCLASILFRHPPSESFD